MNIVITAGGTKEAIDKVRHITNMSSGALGREIALKAAFKDEIEKVYFLSPKEAFPSFTFDKIKPVTTESVDDLYNNLQHILTTEKIDAVIHSMAVSDYKVDYVASVEDMVYGIFKFMNENDVMNYPEDVIEYIKSGEFRIDTSSKMSSKSENPFIKLTPTQKVIGHIKEWAPETILVGFKLLENVSDDELISVARAQMKKNGCDYVWANDIARIRESGHQGLLVEKGHVTTVIGKEIISRTIIEAVVNHKKGE